MGGRPTRRPAARSRWPQRAGRPGREARWWP